MARKSKAEIEADLLARQEEINATAEKRAMDLFSSFMTKFMQDIPAARIAAGSQAAVADATGDRKLAESLAHAMMTASASPAKRAALVSPEERAARDAARKSMIDLIIANNATGVRPIYRVTRKTFLAETMVDPQFRDQNTKQMVDQEINWKGIPNQAMVPVTRVPNTANEEAAINAGKAVYDLYLHSIGNAPVINANTPSQWVTSGKELLRGNPTPAPSPLAGISPGDDPRRLGPQQGAQTIRLLGKTAEPAVITP
jgi:hypothetical protein